MLQNSVEHYEFLGFRLDVVRRQLLKDGEPLPLTQKAFQILLLLITHRGHLLTKNAIIDEIWRDSFVEDSNLTQHIYLLRKTLENGSSLEQPIIKTVPKQGYIFTADVHELSVDRAIVTADSARNSQNGFHRPSPVAMAGRRPALSWRRAIYVTGAAGLALVILVVAALQYRTGHQPPGIRSIAVLPFKPVNGDDTGKVGFGMTDAVITKLSRMRSVHVRPTSSVVRYVDNPTIDANAIGRGLEVDAVLEGTLQMIGDRMRVNVQLVDVRENRPLWAERFDERSTDVFSLQDAIAARVALALNDSISQTNGRARSTPQVKREAYEKYLVGLYFYNKRSRDALEKAEGYLKEAIDLDPDYARAHAILADVYNMQVYYRFVDDLEARASLAGEAAATALRLDDQLPEAHVSMAQYLTRQMTQESRLARRRHLERAIELSPANPTALVRYGWIVLEQGGIADAEAQMRLAQENDPLSPVTNGALCDILIMARKPSEALAFCQKSLDLEPAIPAARFRLADAYSKLGQVDKAIDLVRQNIAINGERPGELAGLAFFYARQGRVEEARQLIAQVAPHVAKEPAVAANVALAYDAMQERAEAVKWYRLAVENSRSRVRFQYDSDFDQLRSYAGQTERSE